MGLRTPPAPHPDQRPLPVCTSALTRLTLHVKGSQRTQISTSGNRKVGDEVKRPRARQGKGGLALMSLPSCAQSRGSKGMGFATAPGLPLQQQCVMKASVS